MKTPNQIEREAKRLFVQFENKSISIDDLEIKLIELSRNFDFSETIITHNEFVYEYIKPQIQAYKESEANHYLLSVNSSGSLLSQFEAQEEDL